MGEQIRLKPQGDWHRRESIDGGFVTACGEEISAFSSRDAGADQLCTKCFTDDEIKTGELELIARDAAEYDPGVYHAAYDEPTDPNGQEKLDKDKL